MSKSVRLSDIAQVLDVSTVTVSKALAGKKGVSDELRDKIKKLASEMGYKLPKSEVKNNINAKNIGILVSERYLTKYNSFYWELYQDVVIEGAKKDCFCILEVLNMKDEEDLEKPKLICNGNIDGLIVIGKIKDEYCKLLKKTLNVPFIFLDFYSKDFTYDCIISDSYYGTYLLTNYLIEKGHRDIAFVGTVLATSSITDRYYGYSKALLEHNIEQKKEWIINDRNLNNGIIDFDSIIFPKQMPTAFVCNCDLVASVFIEKLEDSGYKVPEDISVVGFDNYLFPNPKNLNITTYEVNMVRMSHEAVKYLLKSIKDNNYRSGINVVSGRIVVGNTVK